MGAVRESVLSGTKGRLPARTDRRLTALIDRNTNGALGERERDELESLVALSESLSLVRANALVLLGRGVAGTGVAGTGVAGTGVAGVSEAGDLLELVRARAGDRCEYCRMHQSLQGATFHVEHVRFTECVGRISVAAPVNPTRERGG